MLERAAEQAREDRSALRFVWLEITNRCNLECRHCYAASSPRESATGTMRFKDWCSVMDETRSLGCESVQFIGGEPTLHPRFVELVAGARRRGFKNIEVYTNGTRLSQALCAELKRYGATIAVSFYSPDSETHDRITTRPGSFKRTVKGISEATRQDIPVRAGVIGMADHVNDVGVAADFVAKLGAASVRTDGERHIGRAARPNADTDLMTQLCGACGSCRIAVNALGEISPCVFSHFYSLGHVSEGIADVMRRPQLGDFVRRLAATRSTASCTPRCGPHECSPGCSPEGGSCFPKGCDPSMCNPISCPPRD